MTRFVLAIVLLRFTFPLWAADEPTFGRLFMTPEQRTALDNARRNRIQAQALAAAAEKKPKLPPAKDVTINGVVTRSDGGSTVWVNGHATEGRTEDGMQVAVAPGTDSSIVLHEPRKGRKLRLKVGQRADLVTGHVEESYEARRLQADPTAKEEHGVASAPAVERPPQHKRSSDNQKSPESETAPDETEPPASAAAPK